MTNHYVCYCFHHTEDDIIKDLREHGGKSVILEKIARSKSRGECRCEENHPERR